MSPNLLGCVPGPESILNHASQNECTELFDAFPTLGCGHDAPPLARELVDIDPGSSYFPQGFVDRPLEKPFAGSVRVRAWPQYRAAYYTTPSPYRVQSTERVLALECRPSLGHRHI